jgi:DNA-binding XRE family transcriptional regulator
MALTAEQLKKLRRHPARNGNRVKAARELAQLTQVQLAEAVGISQPSLSDMERQRYDGVTVDTAGRLAAFFGCLIEDLWPAATAAGRVA